MGLEASKSSILLDKFDGRRRGTTGPKQTIFNFPIHVPRPASLKSLTPHDKKVVQKGASRFTPARLTGAYRTRLEDLANDGHALCAGIGKESSRVTRRTDSAIIETSLKDKSHPQINFSPASPGLVRFSSLERHIMRWSLACGNLTCPVPGLRIAKVVDPTERWKIGP